MIESTFTPPKNLIDKWVNECPDGEDLFYIACAHAAKWGADQELEACCTWMIKRGMSLDTGDLRAVRRPKPSSLKEQALEVLMKADGADHPVPVLVLPLDEAAVIRRALESLPD